jgi:hypothetical protein
MSYSLGGGKGSISKPLAAPLYSKDSMFKTSEAVCSEKPSVVLTGVLRSTMRFCPKAAEHAKETLAIVCNREIFPALANAEMTHADGCTCCVNSLLLARMAAVGMPFALKICEPMGWNML